MQLTNSRVPKKSYHVVAPGRGTATFTFLAGFYLGMRLAGVKVITAGGPSGGSPVSILFKCGMQEATIAAMAATIVSRDLLDLKLAAGPGSWRAQLAFIDAVLMRRVYEKLLPTNALFGTERFGQFFARHVHALIGEDKELPDGFWTVSIAVASNGGRQKVVFTSQGVWVQNESGCYDKVSDELPPVGDILRSTIAIPGILEPIPMEIAGKIFLFYDGVLSTDEKHCPTSPLIQILGQTLASTIIFDAGEEPRSFWHPIWTIKSWFQDWLYWLVCRSCYVGRTIVEDDAAAIVIKPKPMRIPSMSLKVGEIPKICAILEGCRATVEALHKAGVCDDQPLILVRKIIKEVQIIIRRRRSLLFGDEEKARVEIEALLARHNLFDLKAQPYLIGGSDAVSGRITRTKNAV